MKKEARAMAASQLESQQLRELLRAVQTVEVAEGDSEAPTVPKDGCTALPHSIGPIGVEEVERLPLTNLTNLQSPARRDVVRGTIRGVRGRGGKRGTKIGQGRGRVFDSAKSKVRLVDLGSTARDFGVQVGDIWCGSGGLDYHNVSIVTVEIETPVEVEHFGASGQGRGAARQARGGRCGRGGRGIGRGPAGFREIRAAIGDLDVPSIQDRDIPATGGVNESPVISDTAVPRRGTRGGRQHHGEQSQRRGYARSRVRKPRGWTAPEIMPRDESPARRRERGDEHATLMCLLCGEIHQVGDKQNACAVSEQYYSRSPSFSGVEGDGHLCARARHGPGSNSITGSPLGPCRSPLHCGMPTELGFGERGGQQRRVANLASVFDTIAQTNDWLATVTNFAEAEVDIVEAASIHSELTCTLSPPQQRELPCSLDSVGPIENQAALVDELVDKGFVTPPRLSRHVASEQIDPFTHYSGWTTDSQDSAWQAEYDDFAGFTGNDSDDQNSDWLLLSDVDPAEIVEEPFHVADYEQYSFIDPDQRAATERIRHLYRDSEWGQATSELHGDRGSFTGPFPGPTQRHTRNRPRARSFFDHWWNDETMERIVQETNTYASQQCTNLDDPRRRGRPAGTNGGPNWTRTTPTELRAWFGVVILMGLKLTPDIRAYWRQETFWHCNLIPRVFRRDRFESLLRCIHLVDNNTAIVDKQDPAYDKIHKVRWLLIHFVAVSQRLYNPQKFITCDEIMIAYRGFKSPIRQYMPAKPTRYGFKVWAAVSSNSGYIHNIIPYLGKRQNEPEVGLGERVVHQLTAGLQNRGHTIICDNFFTSPQLFDSLLRRGIFATGTVKGQRIGFPSSLCGFQRDKHPRNTLFWSMHSSKRMAGTTWYDSKPVSFLSTSADPLGPGTARRWLNGVRESLHTTPQQVEYQQHMKGVDLVDQMRRDYTVQYHSRKWWHKLLFFVVDSSIHNSWKLYVEDRLARGEDPGSRLQFIYDLACQLLLPRLPLPRTCCRHNQNPSALHYIQTHEHLRRRCRLCKRKQANYCDACGFVFMCQDCFPRAHSNRRFALRCHGTGR